MAFREGFRAEGEIDLLGANIGGQIDFSGATLIKPDGIALDLQQAQLQRLILRPPVTPRGIVSLIYTEIGVLADAVDAWPETLGLTGLVYQTLRERTRFAVRDRLRWLERNEDGYTPQPYEQLAAVYRHAGRDQDARTVAIAKQRTRRRTLGLAGRLWSRLLDGLVGYGYRTWLAGVWLTGFWLVG